MHPGSDGRSRVDAVLKLRPLVVAIDLRGLSFIDSSGIHILVRVAHHCRRGGGRCFLIRGNATIEKALRSSGLAGYFETYDSPDWVDDGEISLTAGQHAPARAVTCVRAYLPSVR